MAQSVLVGIGPAELALVEGERPAVAVDQAAESALAIVNGESGAVVVNGEQVASVAMIANHQLITAITDAQSTNVSLIDSDPGMAAVGVLSRTMVAVANKVEIAAAPVIQQGGLATVNLSPSLEFIVPEINIF